MRARYPLIAAAILMAAAPVALSASQHEAADAFRTAMNKMHQAMPMEFTGQADVDFVKSMIPHHQGAIDMAKVELQYGKDPKLREMAKEIIAAQEKEIAEMQAWLKANGS